MQIRGLPSVEFPSTLEEKFTQAWSYVAGAPGVSACPERSGTERVVIPRSSPHSSLFGYR